MPRGQVVPIEKRKYNGRIEYRYVPPDWYDTHKYAGESDEDFEKRRVTDEGRPHGADDA